MQRKWYAAHVKMEIPRNEVGNGGRYGVQNLKLIRDGETYHGLRYNARGAVTKAYGRYHKWIFVSFDGSVLGFDDEAAIAYLQTTRLGDKPMPSPAEDKIEAIYRDHLDSRKMVYHGD